MGFINLHVVCWYYVKNGYERILYFFPGIYMYVHVYFSCYSTETECSVWNECCHTADSPLLSVPFIITIQSWSTAQSSNHKVKWLSNFNLIYTSKPIIIRLLFNYYSILQFSNFYFSSSLVDCLVTFPLKQMNICLHAPPPTSPVTPAEEQPQEIKKRPKLVTLYIYS